MNIEQKQAAMRKRNLERANRESRLREYLQEQAEVLHEMTLRAIAKGAHG